MADTKQKGGPLALVGITPQFLSNTLSYSVSSGVQTATNQLFKGVGNQYLAQAASSVVSNIAGNVVNVAVGAALGQKVTSLSGLSLSSGANILAATITPYVTGALAQGLNQSIKNSLKNAGPLGAIAAEIGTSLVNQGLNGLTNLITGKKLGKGKGLGGLGGGTGLGTKYFPGAGDEPDADYSGGKAYTLGSNGPDVIFSIRPANSGPQLNFGVNSVIDPKTGTSLPIGDYLDPKYKSKAVDAFKPEIMNSNLAASAGVDVKNVGTIGKDAFNAPVTNPFTDKNTKNLFTEGWKFICAPEEISWTTANAVNRVDMFGTNNPPAVSGTRGMRELTMRNSLVEGFSRNKTVEAKVAALEDLLAYKSSLAGGYVNVPVYQVWANNKGYGQQGYFLIKSVQVKEMMRDLSGNATRATVDVTFFEVPKFQVDSGIDQAPFSQQGKNSAIVKTGLQAQQNMAKQVGLAGAAAQGVGKPGPNGKPAAGPGSANPASRPGGGGTPASTVTGRGDITRLGFGQRP